MCIIAICPRKVALSKGQFYRLWERNSDGGGFAYAHNGRLSVVKELNSKKRLWKLYRKHWDEHKNSQFVLHFRIRTHGTVSVQNVHPFWVNKNLLLFHNGVIPGYYNKNLKDNNSDTKQYMHDVLQKLPRNFHTNQAILNLVADKAGSSRLVFLDNLGRLAITQPKSWSKDETTGVHYSNEGWKDYEKKSHYQQYQLTSQTESGGGGSKGKFAHTPTVVDTTPNYGLPRIRVTELRTNGWDWIDAGATCDQCQEEFLENDSCYIDKQVRLCYSCASKALMEGLIAA